MLSNISVNVLTPSRPASAKLPHRVFIHNQAPSTVEASDSVFLSNDKIILPVKQYSNKFLRENKPREELIYNYSIMRPKKSFVYTRKQLKSRKQLKCRKQKGKQNEHLSKATKTEASAINSNNSFVHSVCGVVQRGYSQTPTWKATSTSNKIERISTSRALEMFSKVFKNENIERMKIRRELQQNTSDVQVKQVALQQKQEKKRVAVMASKKPTIGVSASTGHKTMKNRMLFCEEENFQLVGW